MAVAAATIAADADNSDEEVYATAKAVDGGAEMEYDSDDNPIVVSSSSIVWGMCVNYMQQCANSAVCNTIACWSAPPRKNATRCSSL